MPYNKYKSLQLYNGLPKIGNKFSLMKRKRKGNYNYLFGKRLFGNIYIYKKLRKNYPMYKYKKIEQLFDKVIICVSHNTVNFNPLYNVQQIYQIEQNTFIGCFSKYDGSYIGQFRLTYFLVEKCEIVDFYTVNSGASVMGRTDDGRLYDIRDVNNMKRINDKDGFIKEILANDDERISEVGLRDKLQSTIG